MTFFFNMIDVAGIAAYVIWRTKNPQWNNNKRHRRRIFLQQLGRSLVNPYLNQRSKTPQAVQQGARLAMSNIGILMARPVNTRSASTGRQRCNVCPRKRDKKSCYSMFNLQFSLLSESS